MHAATPAVSQKAVSEAYLSAETGVGSSSPLQAGENIATNADATATASEE